MALVLLADTDLARLLAADPICTSEGHEVLLVPDGSQLLGLAAKRRPDLVILPETLPDMPGLKCTRALRDRVGPQGTLIALTVRDSSPALARQAQAAGCDRVLQAPASRNIVYELLKTVMPGRAQVVRVPLDVPVELNPGQRTATARNISRHGMRLDVPDVLSVGARVELALELPRFPTRFRVEAVVAWSRQTPEGAVAAGVRFENVGRVERQIIDTFIMTSKTALRV